MAAVELGAFTELSRRPGQTAADLASKTGIHARGARDFFDALASLGMLQRDDAGRYRNTRDTDFFLDSGKPTYVGGLLSMLDKRSYSLWGGLVEGLRSGEPQNESKETGKDNLFAAMFQFPDRMKTFLDAMASAAVVLTREIALAFPWGRFSTVLDLGTARGALPVQIALTHKHISAAGFDLPEVRPYFEEYVRSYGLQDRVTFHGGNFLTDEKLPTAEVLVLGKVLHNWSPEKRATIVGKAYRALPPGGALIAYDSMIDDKRSDTEALVRSLVMLLETDAGSEYTVGDGRALFRNAGFSNIRIRKLPESYRMLVGFKAG